VADVAGRAGGILARERDDGARGQRTGGLGICDGEVLAVAALLAWKVTTLVPVVGLVVKAAVTNNREITVVDYSTWKCKNERQRSPKVNAVGQSE